MKQLLVIALFMVPAFGQGEDRNLGTPIYWDANAEGDMDTYGVYRSETPCTDPTPTPLSCTTFVEVASVPQAADPIQWTEPGPVTYTQDYYYRVSARNTSGAESGLSNELNLRWLNPNAPAIPGDPRTGVSATIIINGDNNNIVANFHAGDHPPVIIRTTPEVVAGQ